MPSITQNADELQFAWLGLSLWQHGVPLTWGYFGPHSHQPVLHLHGTVYPLVRPWFDHPPLWGLITGGAALLAGQTSFAAVDMSSVRLPAILLATAGIPLLQALGRRLFSPAVGAVAALLTALSPPLVLMSRVAEPEALLAPLFLAALLLAHRRLEGGQRAWELPVLLACCFFAPLAKVTGLCLAGVLVAVFLAEHRLRDAALCAAAGALSFATFAVYGAVFGWDAFVAAIATQSGHRSGVMAGLEFIAAFAGNNHHLYDGWWLLGWLGVGAVALRAGSRSAALAAWPVAAYLAVIVLLANQQWVATYGWYRVAVYPLVYLGAAALAWRLVEAPTPAVTALVLSLGGATAVAWWLGTPWVPGALVAMAIFAAALAPVVLGRPRLASQVGWLLLALLAVGCLLQSVQINALAGLL